MPAGRVGHATPEQALEAFLYRGPRLLESLGRVWHVCRGAYGIYVVAHSGAYVVGEVAGTRSANASSTDSESHDFSAVSQVVGTGRAHHRLTLKVMISVPCLK